MSTADSCEALHGASLPFRTHAAQGLEATCSAAERWRASWPVPRHSHLQDTGRPLTSRLHNPKPQQSGALSPSAGLSKPGPTSRRALTDVLNAARQQHPTRRPAETLSNGATAAGQVRQQPPDWDQSYGVAAAPAAAAASGVASPAWHRSLHITVPEEPGLQALGAEDGPEGSSADLTPVDPRGGVIVARHGASQSPASAASDARAALVYNPCFGSSLTHSLGAERQAGATPQGELDIASDHVQAGLCACLLLAQCAQALCMPAVGALVKRELQPCRADAVPDLQRRALQSCPLS